MNNYYQQNKEQIKGQIKEIEKNKTHEEKKIKNRYKSLPDFPQNEAFTKGVRLQPSFEVKTNVKIY